jgi:uncharacterized repeat protein (TIGR01451 family)
VVVVEFWPLTYNAGYETLHLHTQTRIGLRLQGSDAVETLALRSRYASPAFEARLSRQLLNYELGGLVENASLTNGSGYLIITADAYEGAIAPLASLKTSQGFAVTVTPLSAIPGGSSASAIHAYIQDAYDTWPTPPSYVLLVGDTNTIPGWNSVSAGEVTDLYYRTMDGPGDWVPDVELGRFPVRSSAQATTMVDKVIAYANTGYGVDWLEKIAFIATCDQHTVAEGTHNYAINTYTEPEGCVGTFPDDPQPGGDRLYCITHGAGENDIRSSLNDGRWAVIYSGHGGWTGWEMNFGSSDVQALTSVGTYPFVASHACITGDFARTEVFGETWVLQPDKGALVFWGSSDSSYWGEDDVLERAAFDALFGVPQPTVGAMTDYGLAAVQVDYPGSARYYWETYNLLGDPSVSLITDVPDFTVGAFPYQRDVAVSGVATYTVEVNPVLEYDQEVGLSLVGLPADTQSAFSPDRGVPPFNAELVVTTTTATPHGSHPLTIQGSDAFGTSRATQVNLTVHPRPILTASREATPHPVEVGTELEYTLTVTNAGGPASGVIVSDVVPAETTLAWASHGGALEGDAVVWRRVSLTEGESAQLSYALTVGCVTSGTQVVNEGFRVTADELLTPVWGPPITVTAQSEGVTADFTVGGPVLRRSPAGFTNLSANATAFAWTFGDGASSSDEEPSHSYTTTGEHTARLTASNACSADTVTRTLTVEDYALEVGAAANFGAAAPGEGITYTLRVTNTGTLSESFRLSILEGEWQATVEPTYLSLNVGATATTTVTVSVPHDATGGTEDEVQVVAKANSDPRTPPAFASEGLTARADDLHGVQLTPATAAGTGQAGTTVTYHLTLVNSGNVLDTFTLERTNPGWRTTLDPASIEIAAFGVRNLHVQVTVPPTATLDATDRAVVRATGTDTSAEVALTTSLPATRCYLPILVRE